MKVLNPGKRGGKFWVDEHGSIRYGPRPLGARAAPTSAPPEPAPSDQQDHPHHGEFGPWSGDAVSVYVHQALRYAPCLANVIQRYLDLVSRYGMGEAASQAMGLLTPEDVPAATSALGRLRRLAHWDRYGRVQGEGAGTPIPTVTNADPAAVARNPFVRAAMQRGMSQDAALLWQQLALRMMNDGQGALGSQRAVGEAILAKSQRAWLIGRHLLKATSAPGGVMKPGSRGGRVYWKNGRLHYGVPSPPKARGGGGGGGSTPTWRGPGPLARALMRQGRRVEWRAASGLKIWGTVITASGEILSVLPDDAKPYDLLHTVCVPVSAVLRVAQEQEPGTPDKPGYVEKSVGREEGEGSLGYHAVAAASRHREAEADGAWPAEAD